MTALKGAVDQILSAQVKTDKPLAIILAGHNGPTKTTIQHSSMLSIIRCKTKDYDAMSVHDSS